ncbi:MAG: hypothetical protein ACMG6E_02835 [Candidatus Roizmanbacteria bacterium]
MPKIQTRRNKSSTRKKIKWRSINRMRMWMSMSIKRTSANSRQRHPIVKLMRTGKIRRSVTKKISTKKIKTSKWKIQKKR